MIYMVIMYNVTAGMMANLALIVNVFFTLGILTSFQAALTLPGLAGIVLSLGTAVDANVLIFERIKEELRGGKGMKQAVAAGYGNAFSAIFDSNLTSLITGVILLVTGTGPIGGATFQVPTEIRAERKESISMKNLIAFARKRGGKTMADKLAAEIMDAYNNQGGAFKRKEDMHRMAEANRAFAHFRF